MTLEMMNKAIQGTVLWLAFTSFSAQNALGANPRGFGLAAAEDQLESFTVAGGLEVSLFASEPMVVNPSNMDIDARGRVWVTEGANYRVWQRWGKLRPGGDRILILEDTNHDGLADKTTVFYQGEDVNTALGICVLGNRVIVSRSPNVLVFTDTDGDDHADTKEVLFQNIGGIDHDHGVHAAVFGPDGKLYFNFGNAGKHLSSASGSPIKDPWGRVVADNGRPYRQGMVFRCNLDGSEFEVLGKNFRNNFEVAVDSFGTLWQSDNDDDGNRGVRINYVMEFGNFGYQDELTGKGWKEKRTNWAKDIPSRHWHQHDPGVIPNLLQTGAGSPTGICIYEGDLLPDIFHNQMIHCDAGPRVVRSYPVQNRGAGYQAKIVNILTSSDTWFRPSDVCVAPDGSLLVVDWNDAGVGGHNMADQKLETMTGRVYRIAPSGHGYSVPKLDLSTPAGRRRGLESPNLATRYLAWSRFHRMGPAGEKELLEIWHGPNLRHRARALQLLARIQGKARHYVESGVRDPEPDIRITALRIARTLHLDVIPVVRRLVKDPSPQVRRECAIALHRNPSAEAPYLWADLAVRHDGKDRWYLEALGIGAAGHEDACLDAWLKKVGSNWNTPAGRDIIWRSRTRKTPGLLVKLIKDKQTTDQERPRYFRSLDFLKGPEKDAALLELLTGGGGKDK